MDEKFEQLIRESERLKIVKELYAEMYKDAYCTKDEKRLAMILGIEEDEDEES